MNEGPPDGGPSSFLVAACADLHIAWMGDVARATGGLAWAQGGTTWIWSPRPHAELVIPFPGARVELDGGLARGRELGARRAGCWATGPDEALATRLRKRGFDEGWHPHWMALDLSAEIVCSAPPDVAGADVAVADAVPEWDDYGRALLTMPRARAVLARVDGTLAGFAWMHPGEAGSEAAGLFDLVVFAPFRRRGLGAALTLAAARLARDAGRDWLTLNATGDGRALYETLGFESLGDGRTWWRHGP